MEREENLPIDTEWFHERIAQRGLSISRLARLISVDAGNLSRMLRGQLAIHLHMVEPMADILGADVATIVRKATTAKERTKRKSAG
jgi:transcriptional regulator with XRE-family HTH domain